MITHPDWDRRMPLAIGTLVGLGLLTMVGTAAWFVLGMRQYADLEGFELLRHLKPMLRPLMAGVSTGMSIFIVGVVLHWANDVRLRG